MTIKDCCEWIRDKDLEGYCCGGAAIDGASFDRELVSLLWSVIRDAEEESRQNELF
jgi:hypothetical protein